MHRIGRHRTNDIIVDDATVSRHHAELTQATDGRYYLVDVGSSNGTYVNARGDWTSIDAAYVAPDERILLGDFSTSPVELLSAAPPDNGVEAFFQAREPSDADEAAAASPAAAVSHEPFSAAADRAERAMQAVTAEVDPPVRSAPSPEPWFANRAIWAILGGAIVFAAAVVGWLAFERFAPARSSSAPALGGIKAAPLTWERTYGGDGTDSAQAILATSDGGYIVAGSTTSMGPEKSQAWIIRLDSRGGLVWQRAIGPGRGERAAAIRATPDGGYIVVGASFRKGLKTSDLWVFKLDAEGSVRWEKTFGGDRHDAGLAVTLTPDAGYLIAGTTELASPRGIDLFLVKLAGDGVPLWQRNYGGKGEDALGAGFQATSDGGNVAVGWSTSKGKGKQDLWLTKLDSAGRLAWDRTHGGRGDDGGRAIRQTADDGYIIAGFTDSLGVGGRDVWLLKLDAKGRRVWDRTYGTAASEDSVSILEVADGGYFIAGTTVADGGAQRATWLLRFDESGTKLWDRRYDSTVHGLVRTAQQTSDGGFIVAGETVDSPERGRNVWVMRVDKDGLLKPSTP